MLQMIGGRLKAARKRAELSQQEVAERIHVHKQTVSDWERGEALPAADNLDALAEAAFTSKTPPLLRGQRAIHSAILYSWLSDETRA